jgi:16S rRNA processing protein RimM
MGRSSGSFGLKGEVRVYPYTGEPDIFLKADKLYAGPNPEAAQEFELESLRRHKGRFLLKVAEINTKEEADKLKGYFIYISQDQLPALAEDEYYWFQLKGIEIRDLENRVLGQISHVTDPGGQEIWVVKNSTGQEALIPATDQFVARMEISKGYIQVDLPEGLLESQGFLEP